MIPALTRALMVLAIAGCTAGPPEADGATGATPDGAPSDPAIAWIRLRAPDVPALTELPAHVVGDPGARSEIAVPYASRVVEVHVRPGDRVAAGDAILEVAVPDVLRAQAAIAGVDARIEPQRRRADQLRALQREGIVGAREVFELDAAAANLDAERRLAVAVLAGWGDIAPGRRGTLKLRAPTAGIVVAVDATIGEVRDGGGAPLVEIRGEGPARIEVRTPQALPPFGTVVFIALDGREIPLSSEPEASLVDGTDGTTITWLRPDPPCALPGGMRGRVMLGLAHDGVVQVPERSVKFQGGQMVVVLREGDRGTPVAVEIVARSGSTTLVRGPGLVVGAEVASDATAWVGAEAP